MTVLWEWGFEGTPTLFSFFSGFLCDMGLLVFKVTTDLGTFQAKMGSIKDRNGRPNKSRRY